MSSKQKVKNWLTGKLTKLLTTDREVLDVPLCDFARLRYEMRVCDVILVEGRTRLSDVIKTVSLSCWTHSALYIGRLVDIENEEVRNLAKSYYPGSPNEHLVIESLLGKGTIISPLTKYQHDNIRICRPKYLSPDDSQKVIETALRYLGCKYSTRHILDLARFMLPYGIFPRRWRSSLFRHKAGNLTHTICSTMLVEAFSSVSYPVLPVILRTKDNKMKWFMRNANLFTPKDFDYSPFFEIIKFPFMGDDMTIYRNFPWDKTGVIYNDETECFSEDLNGMNGKEKEGRKIPFYIEKKE